jgi:hypothetical protein
VTKKRFFADWVRRGCPVYWSQEKVFLELRQILYKKCICENESICIDDEIIKSASGDIE